MLALEDRTALAALSDALADAAEIHSSSAKVALDAALRSRLACRAKHLEALSSDARSGLDDDKVPGSMLAVLDRLRLQVDQWFGNDDKAADTATRKAKADLVRLVDGYLASPELSEPVRSIFTFVRAEITKGQAINAPETGLAALPG